MGSLFALPAQNDFGDDVPNGVAGPLGLFITVVLVVATVLLIRDMNKRLRRLPLRFDGQVSSSRDANSSGTSGAAVPADAAAVSLTSAAVSRDGADRPSGERGEPIAETKEG